MTGYGAVFALAEFRAIWLGRAISLLGDQLARVALSVLVFDRTGSAVLTGLVYALTFLPYLVGPLLAGVADRRSRRSVMIVTDLFRAGTIAAMAIPGLPLPVLCVLLTAATMAAPLFDSARSAVLPDVVTGDAYTTGLAVMTMTTESTQVVGFALGGVLVAALGARPALLVDALTFALSAVLVWALVSDRPVSNELAGESPWMQLRTATRVVFGSPMLRAMVALAWLNSVWMVPEGLAAPYAAHLGGGATAVGILLAAIPLGAAVGALVLARFVPPAKRLLSVRALALGAAAPLLACALDPGLWVTVALWAVCGLGTAYNLPANAAFVQRLPGARRAQAFALVGTGLVTGQGLAVLAAGGLAGLMSPPDVVALAGGVGIVVIAALSVTYLRAEQLRNPGESATELIALASAGPTPAEPLG